MEMAPRARFNSERRFNAEQRAGERPPRFHREPAVSTWNQ